MMTVHKLSAGDGYTYLTRQVASADQARDGQALADYYADSGTPPGRWIGAGARQAEICGAVSEIRGSPTAIARAQPSRTEEWPKRSYLPGPAKPRYRPPKA